MHNPLTKIMIVFGTLIAIFASLSPRTLHAAALSPVSVSPALTTISTSSLSTTASENSLTVAQPLGSLTDIAWNKLEIADSRPSFLQYLTLPMYAESQPQADVSIRTVNASANVSAENHPFFSVPNPIDTLKQSSDTRNESENYHNTCQSSSSKLCLAISAFENQQSELLTDHSWVNVSCMECHTLTP